MPVRFSTLRLRLILACAAVLWAAGALPGLAQAHAELVTSEPASGSTVSAGLSRLVLSFSEPPAAGSSITLYTGVFQAVPGVNSYVANGQLWADVDPPLGPGTYTVQWSAVSPDGHTVEASYQFAVAAAASFPWAAILVVVVVLIVVGAFPFFLVRGRRSGGAL
jgi:methionine-rich copper-binding protein CopC